MRFLTVNDEGALSFTGDLIRGRDQMPKYAILSHLWSLETEEVSYHDVLNGHEADRRGFGKIVFCISTAAGDGINHVWVDTCCINKTNSAELSRSINSMFEWYRDADKCYVYLVDVSYKQADWLQAFRQSRWFTRGWTLQELVAPSDVQFFSKEGIRIGTKRSLVGAISAVTNIPILALKGDNLAGFSVAERFSWTQRRNTSLPEDKAYALLGIFGVALPVMYGEGEARALGRLRDGVAKVAQDSSSSSSLEDTQPYTITVKTLVGRPLSIPIDKKTSSLQVKMRVLATEGVPIEQQYLVCDGRWLPEAAILFQQAVRANDTIYLILPIWQHRYLER